jgi:pimeloyl-ACP methyl ester carboxylesterase
MNMTRVIYLHGFASSPASSKARFFRESLERAGFRVDVPDLAAGDFEHLTITGQLAVVEQIAAGEPVSLIGSSLGGYLAALYAARHPEVRRAVLLAPAFVFSRLWSSTEDGPEEVEEWRRTGTKAVFHYGENRMCQLGYQLLADAGRYEDYPEFSQPALIFHGIHDESVPVSSSREFAAAHSNATLEVLDSDHQLLNVLDYLATRIIPFLTER